MAHHARGIDLQQRSFVQPFSTTKRHYRARKVDCRCKHSSTPQQRSIEPIWLTQLKLLGSAQVTEVGTRVASAALAAVLAFGAWTTPVDAVTNEQLLFLEAWRAVDRAYYDKNFNGKPWFKIREQMIKSEQLNTRQETYAAIRSLLAQLDDPFTRFLEPSRYAALKRGTAGSLTGVGLEVGFDLSAGTDSNLLVITPSADGPADKAGIKPRDAVLKIDGKPTSGISLYDAGELLQGTEGSQITLTIKPSDGSPEKDVTLSRQRLTFNPVTSQLCKKVALGSNEDGSPGDPVGKVGYIRVATFSKQTTENVKAALHQLQAEGAARYVLDIRNNGGGLFPAGVEVARMLLKEGDIVLIADSQGVRDSYSASGFPVESSAPLSVLVNRGTASASEVLAGALKDNLRGIVVGETTFGKGLIQTIVELSDGSGVAVTVARYQTPEGTDINKKGIQPDIAISTEQMPPTNGPGFCKYVAATGANVLFDLKSADYFKETAAAQGVPASTEDASAISKPIDVTQSENAMPGTGTSTSVPEPSSKGDEESGISKDDVNSVQPSAGSLPSSEQSGTVSSSPEEAGAAKVAEPEGVGGDAGTVGGDAGILESGAAAQPSDTETLEDAAASSSMSDAESSGAPSSTSDSTLPTDLSQPTGSPPSRPEGEQTPPLGSPAVLDPATEPAVGPSSGAERIAEPSGSSE